MTEENVVISQNISIGGLADRRASRTPIMSIEQLVTYGFKEYTVNRHSTYDRNWQYCVRTPLGKKLHVDVRLWQFSKYSTPERGIVHDSFDAESQFDMNGPKTFNVQLSVNDMTPAQVVEWFERMHTKLGCVYYERYADEQYDEEGVQTSFNCEKCGRYLSPDEAVALFLCPGCKYEKDSGFKPGLLKRRPKRRK